MPPRRDPAAPAEGLITAEHVKDVMAETTEILQTIAQQQATVAQQRQEAEQQRQEAEQQHRAHGAVSATS